MDFEIYKKIKKPDCIKLLDDYYKSINRTNPPNYKNYSLVELKLCLRLFNINLTIEN
jgi:hypothetical protein